MTHSTKQRLAYINGEWTDDPAALTVSVDDIGFLVGATVSDRLRTFAGKVFRLDEHAARFQRSLEIVGIDTQPTVDEMRRAVADFPQRNRDRIDAEDDWSISVFATPGVVSRRKPTLCVHGQHLPFADWSKQYESGLAVRISDVRQVPSNCWPRELKCRSRMHYYLADRDAAAQEAGARAVLLDESGYVIEASTANILLHYGKEGWVTPRQETVLPGISQSMVARLAESLELPWTSRDVSPSELTAADEVMLTSTSSCILPVVRCDGKQVGNGKPGDVFRLLLAAWSEAVGVDIVAQAQRFENR